MTSEQMRAELEREGYVLGTFSTLVYKGDITWDTVHNDDGLSALEQAYDHLQRTRKLAALEAENTVLRAVMKNILAVPHDQPYADLYNSSVAQVAVRGALEHQQQFGITADESDEHE